MKLVELYRILVAIEVDKKKTGRYLWHSVMEQRVFSEDLK